MLNFLKFKNKFKNKIILLFLIFVLPRHNEKQTFYYKFSSFLRQKKQATPINNLITLELSSKIWLKVLKSLVTN